MLKLITLTAALILSACLDESAPTSTDSGDDETVELARDVPGDKADDIEDEGERNICDLLPTEGACAHACDPETMMTFVPEGTCAVFHCQLSDGTIYNTGGCNR